MVHMTMYRFTVKRLCDMIKTYNHLHYSYANYKVELLYVTETKQKQNKGTTATTKNLIIENEIVTKDSLRTYDYS